MNRKLIAAVMAVFLLGGCTQATGGTPAPAETISAPAEVASAPAETADKPAEAAPSAETASVDTVPTLNGHKLMVFCGAGMKKPFSELAETFKTKTGCEMELNFANAAQIQSQINTAKEGDLFIAGSAEELKPVQEMVVTSKDLVKHIPILAVQKGNPKGIKGVADLAQAEVRLLLGDAQSTPIGKIGDKVLNDFGIFDKVNLIARTTTAPAIVTALAADECDAAIVWKENAGDAAEIVQTPDMDKYVKTIPAASLSCSADATALEAFLAFLDSGDAKTIWEKHGYELLQ